MNIENLTEDQIEKVFRLCDIMCIDDIYVAQTLL